MSVEIVDIAEAVAGRVGRQLQEEGSREVPGSFIGESVMGELRVVDTVAYVRFASVYRSLEDVGKFMWEVRELNTATKSGPTPRGPRGRSKR